MPDTVTCLTISFQVNANPEGTDGRAKFKTSDEDNLEWSKFIYGGDNIQKNNIMVQSNVTFAENSSFTINNNANQTSNLPNNKDKNLVNSDNAYSVATGDSIFSNLLYKVSDFVNSPSPETLKKFAYQTFEKFASTLPPSADLVPP